MLILPLREGAFMADTFAESMTKTQTYFTNNVLPILKGFCSLGYKCKFVEIEGHAENEITKDFDIYAGIDVYQVRYDTSTMIGIASRIQYTTTMWGTFTVRRSRESGAQTEYAKRKYAIEHSLLYPKLTMQAYILPEKTVLGLVSTCELIRYIDEFNPPVQYTSKSQKGQASFFVCDWQEMRKCGINVTLITEKDCKCVATWLTADGVEVNKEFSIEKLCA